MLIDYKLQLQISNAMLELSRSNSKATFWFPIKQLFDMPYALGSWSDVDLNHE